MAEEMEGVAPFRGSNVVRQRPPNNSNVPRLPAGANHPILARLHELEAMSEMERNKWIQSIDNLSWKQTMEFSKQFDKHRRRNRPVQQPLIGMENESHSCPEMLPEARDGPGVEPGSNVYRMLAKPRTACGVEQPEPWAIADPPDSIPDDGYEQEIEQKFRWSRIKIDTVEFRARWDKQNESQARAYRESHHTFPVVQNGTLTFTSEYHEAVYEPEQSLFDDWLSDEQDEQDAHDLWMEHEYKISAFDIPNENARKQFRNWWDQLPTGYHTVNIYHVAFFDGTAMPDGQCSMFLPGIKHIPTPRDMKDEMTRLHWHETSAGYVYNMGKVNQKRRKKQQEKQEHLRRTAPYRAWLSLPPESKLVPPDIYLRPAELYDASYILEIMNWYAKNSALSSDTRPMDGSDFEKLLRSCREMRFPFVVAARRPQERWCRNQIDPAIGYAYVEFHRNGKDADAHMGELQVFVQEDSKKKHIGRALVDMVLSCFDVTSKVGTDYQFDQTGTVQYGAGYGRPLNTMVCAIASSPQAQENYTWIKEWLKRDFGFQEKGVFEDGRVKSGKGFDLCYMARRIGTPNTTEGG
ncbi:Acyl-CoA N-acyltransferase [Penicillium paradoxum]|uniref:Acyl-CoA N-acyltransferase n=1 Tax=Penicillium paradoxum TaxID=176176 RepID=UPI00254978D1|nr:Acyl-CoA N-acyltransferase [Penicillium paradoxum]KAJ5774912.1 Acyl-CoA N-acyltransferase [Penicillium paradoxum]